MASIDFVFVSQFAKVELDATITAVSAGIRGIALNSDDAQIALYLAGCVSREPGESNVTLNIDLESPDKSYLLSRSVELDATEADTGPYAITAFALQLAVPISGEGRYSIKVYAEGGDAEEAGFWVKFVDVLAAATSETP